LLRALKNDDNLGQGDGDLLWKFFKKSKIKKTKAINTSNLWDVMLMKALLEILMVWERTIPKEAAQWSRALRFVYSIIFFTQAFKMGENFNFN